MLWKILDVDLDNGVKWTIKQGQLLLKDQGCKVKQRRETGDSFLQRSLMLLFLDKELL